MISIASVSLVFAGVSWGGTAAYDPAADPYSMSNLTAQMGAPAWWNAGYTGQGIDVAVIDTGTAPVQGLNTPGKVVYGPDLSLESQNSSLTNFDTNGHGTFMAGLIAGHDPSLTAPYANAPASAYRGIAPDARIVSLKVAAADGGADVTQVIAAIGWVVQHAHDPGMNIRVINLSYGTLSTQSYKVDPLAYAAEQAWMHGIVVVAAAGNTGAGTGNGKGLSDPAYDPYILGVGAYNTMGTNKNKDDVVASYSARTNGCGGCKNPDLVAPGTHMQGLRVVGGYIDQNHPEGVIDDRYFRGSGTSEATAITSGAIALLLQKYPDLTPDEVKYMLTNSAQSIPGWDGHFQGAGALNLPKLLSMGDPNGSGNYCAGIFDGNSPTLEVPTGSTCTLTPTANISGDLKVDPGGTLVDLGATISNNLKSDHALAVTITGGSVGHDLTVQNTYGAVTVQGVTIGHNLNVGGNPGTVTVSGNAVSGATQVQPIGAPVPPLGPLPNGPDAQSFGGPPASGNGSLELSRGGDHISLNGVALSGNNDIFGNPINLTALAQAEASGSSWSGGNWNGSNWTGSDWSGSSWSGSSWSGSSWSGNSWSGSSWSGNDWSGVSWSGDGWSGADWSSTDWGS
ncbi:MAG TPA: S8 family serine peptidase [Gaiellaceae bacterium]